MSTQEKSATKSERSVVRVRRPVARAVRHVLTAGEMSLHDRVDRAPWIRTVA